MSSIALSQTLLRIRRQAWMAVVLCFFASCIGASLHAHAYTVGGLSIAHPWARETAAGQVVGGGFMSIRNGTAKADVLLSATSPMAKEVQMHTTVITNGVMQMREAKGGLTVLAKGTLELKPGGNHLMLMGLTKRLAPKTRVPVTLNFKNAGKVQIELAVHSMADTPDHSNH